MLREIAAVYALMATPGVGYVATGNALRASAEAGVALSDLFDQSGAALLNLLPVGSEDAVQAIARCDTSHIDRYKRLLDRLYSAGGRVVLASDDDYPAALRETLGRQAPPAISMIGRVELLNEPLAAIVGARDASPESCAYAAACARYFADQAAGVVSGGARGVDEIAHRTALDCDASSVFVLPHGLLRYKGGERVRTALESGRAVLMSEFAPDAAWTTHGAITRNRTIAALARLLCVFEPRATGGSVRTAEAALAQGKPVLVHCSGREWRVEQRLVASGAQTLPVHDESALHDALSAAWTAAESCRSDQQELF